MSDDQAQTPPPPPPPAPPPAPQPAQPAGGSGSSDRAPMLVLSYLGPLALIPFLTQKDDAEVQWHAKHGLVLFGVFLALQIVAGIIWNLPWMGCAGYFLSGVVGLGYLVVSVLCIIKALDGQRFKIQVLSDYADKF